MRYFSKISFILVIALTMSAISCKKSRNFSEIPRIELISFDKIYNPDLDIFERGVLAFSFEDGDGDIGLDNGDTFPPFNPSSKYHYNLIITYFEMQNGALKEVPILWFNPQSGQYDTLTLSARIPNLTPGGNNKAISGEIYDTLFIYNFNSPFDTIMFEAYILDRALNESNTISTPLIIRK